MAIIKEKISHKTLNLIKKTEIKFICPTCQATRTLEFPNSIVNEAKNVTTISIPKGLVCQHHFQAFVDKNFMVRGYQKVDFEFKFEPGNELNLPKINQNKQDEDLFSELVLEGNYVEYTPAKKIQKKVLKDSNKSITQKILDEDRKLKKIYEEFWEFIDTNNITFKKFIEADTRRKDKILL